MYYFMKWRCLNVYTFTQIESTKINELEQQGN